MFINLNVRSVYCKQLSEAPHRTNSLLKGTQNIWIYMENVHNNLMFNETKTPYSGY